MKLKRRRVKRGRVEIIPMIDTIVILLIFYMSFSRFVEAGKENKIELPKASAGVELDQVRNQVIINMYDSKRVIIDKREYNIDELPGQLRGIKAQLQQSDPNTPMTIVLRAQKSMTYKDLSGFMRAAAKAGIADITFATLEMGAAAPAK